MKQGTWKGFFGFLAVYGVGIYYGYKIGVAKGELDAYTAITKDIEKIIEPYNKPEVEDEEEA